MATEQVESPGLQIDEDLRHQEREWKIERVGWIAMLLFLLAAVLGVLGGEGPLNRKTVGQKGSALWVEHDRFMRVIGPTMMIVRLGRLSPEERTVSFSLDGDFLERVEVEHIEPEPIAQSAALKDVVYTFNVAEGASEIAVRFDLKPEHIGTLKTPVVKVGGPEVLMQSFVYP